MSFHLMFTFLIAIALAKYDIKRKPIVLVPGLYGSNLYVTYDKNIHVPWYCPKSMEDELLWIPTKLVLPPFINCICYLSQCEFDNNTNSIHSIDNVNITVKDFGKRSSVDYIIKGQNHYKNHDSNDKKGFLDFYDNFGSFIDLYVKNGYEVGKDFFVAPYDWRLAPLFVDNFWPQLKNMIEKAYELSGGQKVTLTGFSMGCFMIQQFLAGERIMKYNKGKKVNGRQILTAIKDKKSVVTQRWINKYIEKVILLAPSFGGSLKAYDAILRRYSPLVPFYKSVYIGDFATSGPGFYAHWPNLQIFKGLPLVRGPDGVNYTVDQLRDILASHSNIRPDHVPIMDFAIDIQRSGPIDIGEKIPLTIIYNSKVPTTSFLDYKNGWDHDPIVFIDGKGDGTVPSEGIRYACDNWKSNKRRLICIDLEKNDAKHYQHGALTSNPYVLDLVYKATNGDTDKDSQQWWTTTGKSDVFLESKKVYGKDQKLIQFE